jgi:hypothetical protein
MTLKTSSKLKLAISLVASNVLLKGPTEKLLSTCHHAASIQTEQYHSMYTTHHMKVKRIGLIRYSPQHFMTDWPDSVIKLGMG